MEWPGGSGKLSPALYIGHVCSLLLLGDSHFHSVLGMSRKGPSVGFPWMRGSTR